MTDQNPRGNLHVASSNTSADIQLHDEAAFAQDEQFAGAVLSPDFANSSNLPSSQQRVVNSRDSDEIDAEDGDEISTFLHNGSNQRSPLDAEVGARRTPASSYKEKEDDSAVLLHRSGYTVFLVATYSSLALTAWILICLLTYNSLTVGQYQLNLDKQSYGSRFRSKYIKTEEIYRAARTLQTIVALLTIPLTSAVCSAAAPVFAQAGAKQRQLTLRQLLVLADKGWTDPATISKLVFGRGKKYGSRLLFFAVLLNILGASITPLQTILVTPKVIKTPTVSTAVINLADIPDQFDDSWDINLVTAITRNALSTSNTAPQARLWQNNFNCSSPDNARTEQCVMGAATLGSISQMSNPYFAQLPKGTHTGVIRQFLPRINSSVRWESVPAEVMPVSCAAIPHAFYVHYSNSTWPPKSDWNLAGGATTNWSIEACMPGDQSISPWKNTYLRQDFTEELYINISVMGYDWLPGFGEPPGSPYYGGVFKVTSKTTAGYFELPNHLNGGDAGEPINDDPKNLCGTDCIPQTSEERLWSRSASMNYQNDDSWKFNRMRNKGPLLTVAMALFGYGSYIPTRLNHPGAYLADFTFYKDGPENSTHHADSCIDQRPLTPLLGLSDEVDLDCITDSAQTTKDLDNEIAEYLQSFYVDRASEVWNTEGATNAFTAAVYLATEAWFTTGHLGSGSRSVYSDPGADTTIPSMSGPSMIVLSLLLGTYLTCVVALSVYSSRKPLWTRQLDSFTMMRIGAEMHEQVPFKVCFEVSAVRILDDTPGFVGDATGGQGEIGVLGIGSNTPLNGVRRYRSYTADAVKEAQEALRRAQETRRRAQFQIHPLSHHQGKAVNERRGLD